MPKPTFRVQPQRHNGVRWHNCETHRAQQWAVICWRKFPTLVGRYSTKCQAEQVADSERRRAEGPKRHYKLGARMGPRPSGRELTSSEYQSLLDNDIFLGSL